MTMFDLQKSYPLLAIMFALKTLIIIACLKHEKSLVLTLVELKNHYLR